MKKHKCDLDMGTPCKGKVSEYRIFKGFGGFDDGLITVHICEQHLFEHKLLLGAIKSGESLFDLFENLSPEDRLKKLLIMNICSNIESEDY